MTVDLQSTPLPLRTNSPKLAMVGGFEPPTSWLTANCSTAELHHQFSTASIYYSTVLIAAVLVLPINAPLLALFVSARRFRLRSIEGKIFK